MTGDALVLPRNTKSAPTNRRGWLVVTVLAILIGLLSLRYAAPVVHHPAPLPNFIDRHNWLVAHALLASFALLTGPWQFLPLRNGRRGRVHRWLGRVYCGFVVAAWIASLPIAAHAATGAFASAGFLSLGLFWIVTTAAGYTTARARQIDAHRRWMTRSYALTCAAITLRFLLASQLAAGVSFTVTYRISAWACWIPNLLLAEWIIHRRGSGDRRIA